MPYSNTPILDVPGLGTTAAHISKAPKIKTIAGKIVMVSIGASVQNQISERMVDRITELTSTTFKFVNLCQPAKGNEDWLYDPTVLAEADTRLANAGHTDLQVQVIWLQNDTVSNASTVYPDRPLAIKADFISLINLLKSKYINVKHIFLNARPYSYAIEVNHAEPKAYLNGYACKWVVEDQIAGLLPIKPWICDLGYLWTDDGVLRSDGFQALETDFKPNDVHLSNAGKTKFGDWMHDFFRTNKISKRYYR